MCGKQPEAEPLERVEAVAPTPLQPRAWGVEGCFESTSSAQRLFPRRGGSGGVGVGPRLRVPPPTYRDPSPVLTSHLLFPPRSDPRGASSLAGHQREAGNWRGKLSRQGAHHKAKIGGEMEERKWDHQAPTQLLVPRAASSPGSLVWLRLVFVPFLGVAWFFIKAVYCHPAYLTSMQSTS